MAVRFPQSLYAVGLWYEDFCACVDRAGAIEVTGEGRMVTLRGQVSREELDDVLGTVRGVTGVERVESQLACGRRQAARPSRGDAVSMPRTARGSSPESPPGHDGPERQVSLPAGGGTLDVPGAARGVVLFAHGSGSSRFSPRNRYVARVLRDAGLATLLVDLLSPGEEEVDLVTRHLRFDIGLLAD